MEELENRKGLIQEVIERTLPKYERSEEFLGELNTLLGRFPLDNVNFEPSTFENLKKEKKE